MLPNNLTSPIPKRNTFSLSSTCTHSEGIRRYTSQIRSLTIRPRDEYELRRPRAAISALTDRPSLGRETLRFPSSLVRSVADAARELPARGSSEKRSFARIRGGGGRGQARTTRPRKTVGQAVIMVKCAAWTRRTGNRSADVVDRVIECLRWRSSFLSLSRPLFTFAWVYRIIIVRGDYSIAHSRANLRFGRFGGEEDRCVRC